MVTVVAVDNKSISNDKLNLFLRLRRTENRNNGEYESCVPMMCLFEGHKQRCVLDLPA